MNYALVIVGAMLLASLAVVAIAVASGVTLKCPLCKSEDVEEKEDGQCRCLNCGSRW